jgi:putative MATE family efflux protein
LFDKTSKKVFIRTLALAAPIIGQELLNSAVNFVDILMIGTAGDQALSAVGTGNEILFLFLLTSYGIVSGSAIFIGQFWGKGDVKSIHKTMGLAFTFSMVAAVLFFIMSQFFTGTIIRFYIDDNGVVEIGKSYLKIVSYTFFLNAFILTVNSAHRCTGHTAVPMVTSIIALLSNITFNYLYIFVWHQGAAGAAKATLIARVIEVVAQIIIMKKFKLPALGKLKNYFVKDGLFLKDYIKMVWPVLLNEVVWSMGVTLYKESYGELGSEAFSAIVSTAPIQQVFTVLGISIGSAAGILIANSLGAGEIGRAIEYSKKSTILAVFMSVIMGILLFISAPFLLIFYDGLSDLTISYAVKIIYIMSFGIILKTYNFTAIVGILRNGGDTVFCLVIDMVSVWCVGVPLAYLGAHILHLPIYYVFLLAYCEEVFKLIPCILRVKKGKWSKNLVEKYN